MAENGLGHDHPVPAAEFLYALVQRSPEIGHTTRHNLRAAQIEPSLAQQYDRARRCMFPDPRFCELVRLRRETAAERHRSSPHRLPQDSSNRDRRYKAAKA